MNAVDIGLAFLEGLALIVSPCILPVLPLVLAASAEGGRQRPYGIIIGFVAAFSLFAIAARHVVSLLGIDLDLIKDMSLALLAVFGLILLSARLSEKFAELTSGLADIGNRLAGRGGEGLRSGIFIGALIGFVWTPCAGPILAAVLVQVIRQQSDLAGNLVIVAFGLGAAVPMLAIALAGRKLVGHLDFFVRHAEAVRRGFGLLILAAVAYIAFGGGALPGSPVLTGNSVERTALVEGRLADGLPSPYPVPELAGIDGWLNSPPLTLKDLKGKVLLVDFWTYSCINCIRTLPYLTDWDRKYRDLGLVVVGVHSPEFEFEKNRENVAAAIAQHGIRYPVALDNRLDTWVNFNNRYWPAHYLVDRAGNVVYTHFGEGDYDVTENNIRFLLGLNGQASAPPVQETSTDQTPETYLGYDRAERFAGDGPVALDAWHDYRLPARLDANEWALGGKWRVEAEKIVTGEAGAALRLNFTARKVFLVLGTRSGHPVQATIVLNGTVLRNITVDRDTLYELVDQKTVGAGLLEVRAGESGLEAYAFTFG